MQVFAMTALQVYCEEVLNTHEEGKWRDCADYLLSEIEKESHHVPHPR